MARRFKQNAMARIVGQWWSRLLGAAKEGSLYDQDEMYASHRTMRDYVCNSIGIGAWGMVFPVLTIVATQFVGAEDAGMFSLAFVTATLLMIVANYGVRTYQVSDIDEAHTFADYQVNRLITCVIMAVAGFAYCAVRGYDGAMLTISFGVYAYRLIDGLADVYEGRLQQMDKFYLAGISQAVRSILVLAAFTAVLFVSRNLGAASIAMFAVSLASFILLTFPLALFETPKSRSWSVSSVVSLLKQCFPLFLALFLFNLIENMPKFVMEGTLPYDNQLYFNALYFPAQGILLTIQLIYKPLLVRLANEWADPARRKRFDVAIVAMLAIIVGVTALMLGVMAWIGIPIMSFMYGLDFEQFRGLAYIMVVAGGVTAAIDFLYQVITVLRRQGNVTKLYLITFAFSVFVPILLITFTGLPGAVIGYLIVMCILLSLLVMEYISIRLEFSHGEAWEEFGQGGSGRDTMPMAPANPSMSARIDISQAESLQKGRRGRGGHAASKARAGIARGRIQHEASTQPVRSARGVYSREDADAKARTRRTPAIGSHGSMHGRPGGHATGAPAQRMAADRTTPMASRQTQAQPQARADAERRERERKARVRQELIRQAKEERQREAEYAAYEDDTQALEGRRSTRRTHVRKPGERPSPSSTKTARHARPKDDGGKPRR